MAKKLDPQTAAALQELARLQQQARVLAWALEMAKREVLRQLELDPDEDWYLHGDLVMKKATARKLGLIQEEGHG